MKAKYTIREISLTLILFLIPSIGFAVDDTTISIIDSKASNANEKADSNNSRIQALEKMDVEIVTLKADKTEVDAKLLKKADVSKVDVIELEVLKKIDKTEVETKLLKKADVSKVDVIELEVLKKIDKTEVETKLLEKADKTVVEAIEIVVKQKAEKSDVDANKALIDSNKLAIDTIELTPGPQGPEGPAGPQGQEGPQGLPGVGTSFEIWHSAELEANANDPNPRLYLLETSSSFCVTNGPSIWIYSGTWPDQEPVTEVDWRAGCRVSVDGNHWVLSAQAQKGDYGNETPWVYCKASCLTWY